MSESEGASFQYQTSTGMPGQLCSNVGTDGADCAVPQNAGVTLTPCTFEGADALSNQTFLKGGCLSNRAWRYRNVGSHEYFVERRTACCNNCVQLN